MYHNEKVWLVKTEINISVQFVLAANMNVLEIVNNFTQAFGQLTTLKEMFMMEQQSLKTIHL